MDVGMEADRPDRATTGPRPLRDPLSLGFEAHRQLMLLRLRWHGRRGVGGR
jgi:hypothetical protein